MTEKEPNIDPVLPEHEQEILDTALLESDQLLARSLHDDELRRRRKRLAWLSALVIGGVVMSAIAIGIMSGWLAISVPVVAEGEEVQGPSEGQWQERLLSTKQSDPWNVGAEIGMDLVRIPGDRPYEILSEHWQQIPSSVRKQILKGFTPGMMGNKGIHTRFFDVMHLGMTDSNSGVRSYAAAYIEMQGLPNFEQDAKGYARWREQNKDRSANEIVSDKLMKQNGLTTTRDEVEQAEEFTKQGWSAWKKQDYNTGLIFFEKAIGLDPQSTSAWNGSGWVQFNSGSSERALKSFQQCLKLAPDHAAALNGMGQVHFSWKEYDKAKKYLLRAAKQDATAAWSGLAKLFLLTGEFKKAKVWAGKLVRQEPEESLASEMLVAAQAGELSDELRQKIEPSGRKSTSSESSADFQRGWQLFFRGKYRASEETFREVLITDAKNPHAINGLGWSLLNQGKHADAKVLLQQALEIEKEHWGAMNGLATCLKAEGELDEAIKLWERIDENATSSNSATGHLATIYLEREQFGKALKCYERLVAWHPKEKRYRQGLEQAKAGVGSK